MNVDSDIRDNSYPLVKYEDIRNLMRLKDWTFSKASMELRKRSRNKIKATLGETSSNDDENDAVLCFLRRRRPFSSSGSTFE